MIPYDDLLYWSSFAATFHTILFWHWDRNGDFLPVMLPVSDHIWARIVH